MKSLMISVAIACALAGCKGKDSAPKETSPPEPPQPAETPKPAEASQPTPVEVAKPTEAPKPATWGSDCQRSDVLAHTNIIPPEITIGAIQNTIGKPDLTTMFDKQVTLVGCDKKQLSAADMATWINDAKLVVPKSCTCKANVCTFTPSDDDKLAAGASGKIVTYAATRDSGLSELHTPCNNMH